MKLFKCKAGGILMGMLAAVIAVGCASVTVKEPACDSKSVSFDVSDAMAQAESQLPSGATINSVCADGGASSSNTIQLPLLTTTIDFDFSGDLGKVGDVAKEVQVSVTKLTLDISNVVAFVSHVEVDVQGTDTSAYPQVVLAIWDPGVSLDAQIKMASPTLFSYLNSGAVTLTFTMTTLPVNMGQLCSMAAMSSVVSSSADMCVEASGTFSKK